MGVKWKNPVLAGSGHRTENPLSPGLLDSKSKRREWFESTSERTMKKASSGCKLEELGRMEESLTVFSLNYSNFLFEKAEIAQFERGLSFIGYCAPKDEVSFPSYKLKPF